MKYLWIALAFLFLIPIYLFFVGETTYCSKYKQVEHETYKIKEKYYVPASGGGYTTSRSAKWIYVLENGFVLDGEFGGGYSVGESIKYSADECAEFKTHRGLFGVK